jgi:hypothetical protein
MHRRAPSAPRQHNREHAGELALGARQQQDYAAGIDDGQRRQEDALEREVRLGIETAETSANQSTSHDQEAAWPTHDEMARRRAERGQPQCLRSGRG